MLLLLLMLLLRRRQQAAELESEIMLLLLLLMLLRRRRRQAAELESEIIKVRPLRPDFAFLDAGGRPWQAAELESEIIKVRPIRPGPAHPAGFGGDFACRGCGRAAAAGGGAGVGDHQGPADPGHGPRPHAPQGARDNERTRAREAIKSPNSSKRV